MKELSELLQVASSAYLEEIPFVIYRKPNEERVSAIIQNDTQLNYLNDYSEAGFVFAPFRDDRKKVLFSLKNSAFLTVPLNQEKGSGGRTTLEQEKSDYERSEKSNHLTLVKKGVNLIKGESLLKVVLSRKEEVGLESADPFLIFEKLIIKYPKAFAYIWYHPKVGLWAGASPETLIRAKAKVFQTMALAGTQSFEGSLNVVWGDKEVQEQKLVTDQLRKALNEELIEVGLPYTKRAGNLVHICTDISGVLADSEDIGFLIDKLHPTAAVCGLPKMEAKAFILSSEGYDREYYTGFLGELNIEKKSVGKSNDNVKTVIESNVYVNLRCMQLFSGQNPKAVLYVGGGITEESDPQLEWEETVQKSKVMKSVLFE